MAVDAQAHQAMGIPWYSEERWERFAPLTGVLAVILWVVGVAVIESAPGAPPDNAAAGAFVGYYRGAGGQILAGAFILMVGSALFQRGLDTEREVDLVRQLADDGAREGAPDASWRRDGETALSATARHRA